MQVGFHVELNTYKRLTFYALILIETNKCTNKQMYKQTNKCTNKQTNKCTNKQTNKQTNKCTNPSIYYKNKLSNQRLLTKVRHVARMGDVRSGYRILVGKPVANGPLERPRRRRGYLLTY
jgi:hypothetical protein